jgi:GT2 family glycosyltransferase
MSSVFVVIVTYNGEKWVRKCFDSLRSGSYPVQTIVIDNGSTDATVSLLETQYPEVTLVRSGSNLGFGQANNTGIKLALEKQADYVFLLNQDAWVENNTIASLVGCMEWHTGYGIVSPVHLNGQYSALDKGFERYIRKDYPDIDITRLIRGDAPQELYPVSFVNAAAWMMSRACLLEAGLFHPLFFHYGEDNELLNRVSYHGFKTGICTRATICHDRYEREESESSIMSAYKINGLVTLMDLRSSLLTGYLREIRNLGKPAAKAFLKGKIIKGIKIAGIYFTLLSQYKTVAKARKALT